MKKCLGILVLLIVLSVSTEAQYVRFDSVPNSQNQHKPPQPYNFWDHATLGGNFGLQFGNYTLVALSPLLNYHFTQNLVIGAGPIYQYYSYTDPYYNYSTSGSIYGGRILAICYLPGALQNIFIMGEYQILNVPYFDFVTLTNTRTTIGIPLVGAGYRQRVGERLYFTLAGLWDLSGSQLSPYYSGSIGIIPPVLEAGVDVGF